MFQGVVGNWRALGEGRKFGLSSVFAFFLTEFSVEFLV